MEGSGLHQENSRQASPQRTEPMGSQRQGNSPDHELEWNQEDERNIEGSVHVTQTNRSPSQVGSHISQRQNNHRAMQKEIDDLKKRLHHAQRRRSPFSSDISSNDEEDNNYRRRSRMPPSETFSYEDKHRRRWKHKGPSSKGLGNDAMNKVLDQVSKSPFMSRPKP